MRQRGCLEKNSEILTQNTLGILSSLLSTKDPKTQEKRIEET